LGPKYERQISFNLKPANGKLLLFPAYLIHMVAPHFDQEPRISMAFNLILEKIDQETH